MALIWEHLVRGFILGLSLGGTCLLTCGPVYAPYLMMRKLDPVKSILSILEISLGRLLAYAAVGAIIGWLGLQIDSEQKRVVVAIGYALVAFMLIKSAIQTDKREKGCAVSKWSSFSDRPFLIGLVTGVNLCPPFLGVVTDAAGVSGPMAGMLVFVAFFAGSSIWLLPIVVFGVIGNKKIMRRVALWGSVLVAIWFAAQATRTAVDLAREGFGKPAVTTSEDALRPVVSLFDGQHAYLLSDDTIATRPLMQVFQEHRKGPTMYATDTTQIRGDCYIFVTGRWLESHAVRDSALKTDGRFVVVLPPPPETGIDSAYTNRIVTFFSKYSFRMAMKGGTLFTLGGQKKNQE